MATKSAEYEKASEDVKKLKSPPDDTTQLKLYGLFKVGNGEVFNEKDKPSSFNFKASYKWKAWKEQVDAGKTPEAAQKEYVELVEKLKQEKGFDG